MKKSLFAIMLAAVAALTIPTKAAAQMRIGVTAGPDLTTLSFTQDLVTVDQVVGYQGGVMGEMMFPGIGFGFDIGLLYVQRGAIVHLGEQKVWASQGYTDPRSYLHFIELPVNLRFKWTRMNGLEEIIAPYVFGGPTFSLLVAHNDVSANGTPAYDYPDGEFGLQCGIGFELFKRWQIQGSYNWGMAYTIQTRLLDEFSAQNRTWSLRLSYFF